MEDNKPLIITISRQLGSGGASIGQKLSDRFGICYADREIVHQAAQKLNLLDNDLEYRDEHVESFWDSLLECYAFSAQDAYAPPQVFLPTNRQLFKAEEEIIRRIADEKYSVIVGRGSSYILRDHPRHVSVLLHATVAFRIQRIMNLFNITEKEAHKMIEHSDDERSRYYHLVTGQTWMDARQYHICIDTGITGFEKSEEIIADYVESRFGKISISCS